MPCISGSAKAVVSTATATTIEAIVPYGFNNQPLMVANGSLSTVWDRQFIVTYPGADAPLTSGSFTTQALFATATVPREHVSADLDGDNKPDIVITNFSTNSISTFKRTTQPAAVLVFRMSTSYPVGLAPGNIAVGDLDGDGRPDVVAGNSSTSKSLSVLLNTTTGVVISLASKIDSCVA